MKKKMPPVTEPEVKTSPETEAAAEKKPKKNKFKKIGPSLLKILVYCKPWYARMIISLILSLLATGFSLISPSFMAHLTNLISEGIYGTMDINAVQKYLIFLLIVYCVSGLVSFLSSYIMITVMQKLSYSLRRDISQKINCLPLKYFDGTTIGDMLSRTTNDVDTVSTTINSSITSFVQAIVQFVGVLIVMFATNSTLAFTAIGSSLFGFIFMAVVIIRSQKYFREQRKNLGDINGHIEEMYTGHDIVRVFGAVKESKKTFDEINQRLCDTSWKSQFFSGLMMPFMGFIGNFGYVAVCVVGAVLTMKGSIDFGTIIAFIAYVRLFTGPLSSLSSVMTQLQSAAAAGERVFDVLNEEELSDPELPASLPERIEGNVEFDSVSFGYVEDKPIINSFSAKLTKGQKIAIVGHTGAGKTTLVNLLMRFYELWGGEIRIDGIPVKDMKHSDVHSLFGMVLQDTWLFEGSYRENIAYGREVPEEKIIEACRAVGMDHFIQTLPEGYDTVLNDRSTLSAGQRQLLTIARAMVENAPMIILDEATSSVDTRTEVLVQQAMDKLTEGRTSFVIAHRLSTIKNADLILVMDKGDIVESGTHAELLAQNGLYTELYNSQFEQE